MSRQLYLECYSGISGDMTVGALLDLGADQNILEQALESLPLDGLKIKIGRVKKSGLDVCDFSVILDQVHDMEYRNGQNTCKSHIQEHIQMTRGLWEIHAMIDQADITKRAKKIASRIFDILGDAKAQAHGVLLSEVQFQGAEAVDSIVDIVAAAVCLDNLDVTDVIVPELYEGRGHVNCQHGRIPIPVPAVVNIVCKYGLQLHLTEAEGELVTPTGAAIVAAVRTKDSLPEHMKLIRTGMGAGKCNNDKSSLLRAMLIEDISGESDCIWKLESNIDDMTGEMMGFVMEELFQAGARDVSYIPVFMKKNRPAYQLNVICDRKNIEEMEQIIFTQTTTIGIRRQRMERTVLPREIQKIETSFGTVQVKICTIAGEKRIYPEYEDVAAICRKYNLSFFQVYHQLLEELGKQQKQAGQRLDS